MNVNSNCSFSEDCYQFCISCHILFILLLQQNTLHKLAVDRRHKFQHGAMDEILSTPLHSNTLAPENTGRHNKYIHLNLNNGDQWVNANYHYCTKMSLKR